MRFIFTCILVICLAFSFVYSQWTKQADFPGGIRDGAFSFTIGDKAYVGGGKSIPMPTDFWEFDSQTSQWTQLGDLPGSRGWAFSFSINGKGYMGGGDSTGNFEVAQDFWEYDPGNDIWTKKADFGGGPRDNSFCFVLNGKAYVGTGYNGQYELSDYWVYDPEADTWTILEDYPGGIVMFPMSFVINNKAYVACGVGSDGVKGTNLVYEYTDTDNSWKKCADFPGSARGAGIGFSLNGKGYVGLGESSYMSSYNDIWEYNPTTDSWTKNDNLTYPDTHTSWPATFVLGNDVYICTGASLTSSVNYGKIFYKYSFPTDVEEDYSSSNDLMIRPNPVSDNLTIKGMDNQNIRIYSSEGIKILDTQYKGSINISGFANGLYFLKAENKVYKFIVYK